jgi:hypothetical protein
MKHPGKKHLKRKKSMFKRLHPFLRGIGPDAMIETNLSCRKSQYRRSVRVIARDIVRTKCTDRFIECKTGLIVVKATCPSPGAARLYEQQVQTYVGSLLRAGG